MAKGEDADAAAAAAAAAAVGPSVRPVRPVRPRPSAAVGSSYDKLSWRGVIHG